MNERPGFRPDFSGEEILISGIANNYVPRPKTQLEALDSLPGVDLNMLMEEAQINSLNVLGFDLNSTADMSEHLAKVAFSRLNKEVPYDSY